jgi:uncharacterized RDD family membrane protein YckC
MDRGAGRAEQLNGSPRLIVGFAGLGWFLPEIGTTLINPNRKAVHDRIANPVVVRVV